MAADPERKREKEKFLPQAYSGHLIIGGPDRVGEPPAVPPAAAEPAPESGQPAGAYPCPCCGYLTFPVPREEAVAYICPVCCWENDVFTPGEDEPSDENGGMTLREAREHFLAYGAVRPGLLRYTRPPGTGETPA